MHEWLQEFVGGGAALYFWSDFTMFDCTHSVESWKFMKRLYARAGIDDPEFWRVMKVWERPSGKIGAFSYSAGTMNASGRDDTALANGVLNGFATYLSACAAWLEKPLCTLEPEDLDTCKPFISLSVCGDDSLGKLPLLANGKAKEFRETMIRNLKMFGFEAKLYTSEDLSDAVYLGMRPYPTRKGWFWGKTIGRATYKMGWVRMEKDCDIMAKMTGIADMHVLCSSHVPILSDLAKKVVSLRGKAKRTPVLPDPNKPWEWTYQSNVQYDDITLAAVARAYSVNPGRSEAHEIDQDVTVQDVKSLIKAIEDVQILPCVVDHWLWRRMVLADDL